MIRKIFNRKSLVKWLAALLAFLSVPISHAISNLLYDFLKNFPNSSLLQTLIKTKLSLIYVLSIFIVLVASLLMFLWVLKENSKSRFHELQKQQQVRLDQLREKQHELEEKQQVRLDQLEKDLTEFIFDVFENHLDGDLIRIVESALKSKGKKCHSLVSCILDNLKIGEYFDFEVLSIALFLPDESDEYIKPIYAVPSLGDTYKDDLRLYIGDLPLPHRRGFAGFTYREKIMQKIFLDQYRQAFLVKIDEVGQLLKSPCPDYINLNINELKGIKSIAAVPIPEKHNNDQKILGVMCVDSSSPETFNTKVHDDKLSKAAQCLSIAIEIQDLLSELH